VILMRSFAGLLAYVVGVSAIISIGVVGLMALQSANRTPSAPIVAAAQKERLAKPAKQTTVDQKKARPDQKHKMVHVTSKRTHEAPTIAAGDAYGYAQEPRRIDPKLFPLFGR
jgi:threonine dehydrogenase-like Zn-dependent dehydrogenase